MARMLSILVAALTLATAVSFMATARGHSIFFDDPAAPPAPAYASLATG